METINVDERDPGMTSKELRQARKSNKIPAAIYGKGVPSLSVFLKTPGGKVKELKMGKHFKVKVGAKTFQATVDEVQKDPVTQVPIHVSLHAVSSDQVMKAEVPINIIGEAKGQKQNGIVTQIKNTISLKGKFKDLPEEINIDITDLDVGHHIEIKDIDLPKGVELLEDESLNVVTCAYSNVSMEASTEEEPTEETATKAAAPEGEGAEVAEEPKES